MDNSIAKVEQFRQLKDGVRKSENYLIVGIDVSKGSSIGCFYSKKQGVILSKYHIRHNLDGLQALCEKIERIQDKHKNEEILIGVEPTGNYHKALCEYLKQKGYVVVYVSTVVAKNNRRTLSNGRWSKNDPRDAYNIVDLMAQGKMLFYRSEDPDTIDTRNYLLIRRNLIKEESALKTRIRNYIWTCYFPELEDIYKSINCPDILTLLDRCPTADDVKAMSLNTFMRIFPREIRPGTIRHERLINIWHCARRSIGCTAPISVSLDAKMIAHNIKRIQQAISDIDKKIGRLVSISGSFRQLLTIPGFGPFTTAVFKTVICDISNFNHVRQLEKLAGVDLEIAESGAYKGQSKISKKGSSLFRYALFSAVNVAVSKNKQLKAIFLEKLKDRGNTRAAKAKLKLKFVSKYIRIAYALLKKDTPFDINMFNVPVREPAIMNVRA